MPSVSRIALITVFGALLLATPDAMAIDNCQTCGAFSVVGGGVTIYCDRPKVGTMGYEYCFIESDGSQAYCFLEGDWCCVTGPMY